MNKLAFFKTLIASVSPVVAIDVGSTGYIDGDVTPGASVSKGTDKFGRLYLTLCVRTKTGACVSRPGVVTVFQRFHNDENVFVMAQNVGYARMFDGAMTDEDMTSLDRLLREGKTTFIRHDFGGSVVETHVELVAPAEALRGVRRRVA